MFITLLKATLWLKAFHVIAVICWFAGLFYLPRLFVYHAQTTDEAGHQRFLVMETKLYKYIMNPAMIAVLITGFLIILGNWKFYLTQYWLHAKLFLVFLLIGYHHICGSYIKKFVAKTNKSHIFYRYFNEIPTVFLIITVILVIVKPF
jgi:putative membrane protein